MKPIEILECALRLLNSKLSRPAYRDYRNNLDMQTALFIDCIREAKAQLDMGLIQ